MTIADVIERMRSIDAELPSTDGVAVFNQIYLSVTEKVAEALARQAVFEDPEFMERLDVVFAGLFLEAYDAEGGDRPRAWEPLFECRRSRLILPIQFALAGMNAHIEHDLPIAVVRTCEELDRSPRDRAVRRDYEAVNALLAGAEAGVRRSFLDEIGTRVDDAIGPVVHLVSSWHIDKARDVAWATTETLWSLRDTTLLKGAFTESVELTVGMGSRLLLTPAPG
jgi:hypothetical protein